MFTNSIIEKITAKKGAWVSYGNDGRHTTHEAGLSPGIRREDAGIGWRARFTDDPHGGDYGWGPLGGTREEAIINLLAERLELAQDELQAERA